MEFSGGGISMFRKWIDYKQGPIISDWAPQTPERPPDAISYIELEDSQGEPPTPGPLWMPRGMVLVIVLVSTLPF